MPTNNGPQRCKSNADEVYSKILDKSGTMECKDRTAKSKRFSGVLRSEVSLERKLEMGHPITAVWDT